jgi:hypothetical protein
VEVDAGVVGHKALNSPIEENAGHENAISWINASLNQSKTAN